jgi:ATP-dependent Clp protease ATP-binding subunit ClpX
MLDIMYELPSIPNLKECIISEPVITKNGKPELVYQSAEEVAGKKAETA